MPNQLSGAELALLYVSATVMDDVRLDVPLRIEGHGAARTLREAARLLERSAAPVEVIGAREGPILVVDLVPAEVDGARHARWIAAMIAEDREAFGTAGELGELLVIGDAFAPPVGEARWADLEAWQSRYLGHAWGGGLGPPLYNFDPPIGVGYAAVIELRATAGGRARSRVGNRDLPSNDR